RNEVRNAIGAGDPQRVRDLAARPEALTQPARFVAALGECPLIPTAPRAELLRAALRRAPSDVSILMAPGRLPATQQNGVECVRWYQAALAVSPGNVTAHLNLGVALRQQGDTDGAIAAFRQAIRLDPANADSHAELGALLRARGDEAGAIAAFRE